MGANDSENVRGFRAAPVEDVDDCPECSQHAAQIVEGARRALESSAKNAAQNSPVYGKIFRWVSGFVVFAASGIGAGFAAAPEPELATKVEELSAPACDPLVEQYLQHMSSRGAELSKRLAVDGFPAYAELVDQLTSVNNLPDDLRLCLLLRRKQPTE